MSDRAHFIIPISSFSPFHFRYFKIWLWKAWNSPINSIINSSGQVCLWPAFRTSFQSFCLMYVINSFWSSGARTWILHQLGLNFMADDCWNLSSPQEMLPHLSDILLSLSWWPYICSTWKIYSTQKKMRKKCPQLPTSTPSILSSFALIFTSFPLFWKQGLSDSKVHVPLFLGHRSCTILTTSIGGLNGK